MLNLKEHTIRMVFVLQLSYVYIFLLMVKRANLTNTDGTQVHNEWIHFLCNVYHNISWWDQTLEY